jgi:hypothetical protein
MGERVPRFLPLGDVQVSIETGEGPLGVRPLQSDVSIDLLKREVRYGNFPKVRPEQIQSTPFSHRIRCKHTFEPHFYSEIL